MSSTGTDANKSNTLRGRLIKVLKSAIQRYDGNIPNPNPTTIVRECKDVNDSSGKPMECLTDMATAQDISRFANEQWSDVYETNRTNGGARQCVPRSINRNIERRERRTRDGTGNGSSQGTGRRNTMLGTINGENRRLHELNRVIQKMPAYRNSLKEEQGWNRGVPKQDQPAGVLRNDLPVDQPAALLLEGGRGRREQTAADAKCEQLDYAENNMRTLDEVDLQHRREGKNMEHYRRSYRLQGGRQGRRQPPGEPVLAAGALRHAEKGRDAQ